MEGGSFASVLANAGSGAVKRPREEFVVHFPHYDKDAIGPASAIYLGDFKLIRVYETGALELFNIAKDPGERRDLAREMPDKVKATEPASDRLPARRERADAEAQSELRSEQTRRNHARPRWQGKEEQPMNRSRPASSRSGCGSAAAWPLRRPRTERARGNAGANKPKQDSACLDVPAHPFDVVLGRPTRDSVTVSVLCYQDTEGSIAYGTQRGNYPQQTPTRQFKRASRLKSSSARCDPTRSISISSACTARTARKALSTPNVRRAARSPSPSLPTRTWTTASSADLYQRTLANALADAPDFHIDLGDTFMTEKHESRENAARQYLAQRFYFGQLCRSAPLVPRAGQSRRRKPARRRPRPGGLAVWSNTMRKRYFPNPVPDGFFTGNTTRHPEAGLLQDYYAWEWGDALFVVLDPFWFTQQQRGRSDNWSRTLGAEQYQWLKRTLEASQAKFKFVFIHHLVGGVDGQCRGGAEAAPLYEWGGRNADGTDGFRQNRPGWADADSPIARAEPSQRRLPRPRSFLRQAGSRRHRLSGSPAAGKRG